MNDKKEEIRKKGKKISCTYVRNFLHSLHLGNE